MLNPRFYFKPQYENSRAIVVGINKYRNASPLAYAVNDAKEFTRVLHEQLSFPKENITCLIDEEATRENILYNYLKLSSNVSHDDRVIFFFAGHGDTRTGSRGEIGFLVPYDANLSDLSTFIRWDEFTRNSELIHAKHILFIMDACYGGLALSRNIHSGSSRFLKDMLLRYSRQVLTAGKANEVVSDSGGPIPGHSVFTGHLIEGLCGKAATPDGIITASGLMAYVYGKVANDINSNQTPHYGHFDGDGDLILSAPQVLNVECSEENKQIDYLITIPYADEEFISDRIEQKIEKCKSLISGDSSTIALHDFAIEELKKFLSATSEDNFNVQGTYSKDELLERMSKYEAVSNDLSLLSACIAYWAKPNHHMIIQKMFSRATDRLSSSGGLVAWINLRWYPLIIQMYCAGISAVNSKRYDSLAAIFYASMNAEESMERSDNFIGSIGKGILELDRNDTFKQLPGHERHYAPRSEYLFKILQPKLDDILFLGKGYEKSFDEFEVILALTVADFYSQNERTAWGPLGRFAWKEKSRYGDNTPLAAIIKEANQFGKSWPLFQAGFFGGNLERFNKVSLEFLSRVQKLPWF